MADDAVTTIKIADDAVTDDKLADGAVLYDQLGSELQSNYTYLLQQRLRATLSTVGQVLTSAGSYGVLGSNHPAWSDPDYVPDGGTTGQALVKASDTDQDLEWSDVASSGGTSSEWAEHALQLDYDTDSLTREWDITANTAINSTFRANLPFYSDTIDVDDDDPTIFTLGAGTWLIGGSVQVENKSTTANAGNARLGANVSLAKSDGTHYYANGATVYARWGLTGSKTEGITAYAPFGTVIRLTEETDLRLSVLFTNQSISTTVRARVGSTIMNVWGVTGGGASVADGSITTAKLSTDLQANATYLRRQRERARITAGGEVLTATGEYRGLGINEPIWSRPDYVPDGGTTGQVLTKSADRDQDLEWTSVAGAGDGSVVTATLADGAVTTDKLADGAVLAAKMGAIEELAMTAMAGPGLTQGRASEGDVIRRTAVVSGQPGLIATFASVDEVPDGGTTGQVLAKASDTDQDLNWTNAPAGAVADGSITNAKLAANAVGTAKIANNAVTRVKIANDAIDGTKIAANSVNSTELVTSAVTTTHISDSAVTNAKLSTDAVTNAKVANNAINTAEISNSAVTRAKIANDAVNDDKIANNSVNNLHMQSNSVQTFAIQDNNVTSAKLAGAVRNALVPTGGTSGQVLAKASNSNNDVTWVENSGSGGGTISHPVWRRTQFTVADENDIAVPASGTSVSDYPQFYQLLSATVPDSDNEIRATASTTTGAVTLSQGTCLLYTSPSPRDRQKSRMPSSA